jgi:hypothetical protein
MMVSFLLSGSLLAIRLHRCPKSTFTGGPRVSVLLKGQTSAYVPDRPLPWSSQLQQVGGLPHLLFKA